MNANDLFTRRAAGLPPDFLRALAYHESGFDPSRVNPASNATGLFQITAPVLADYNRTHASAHTMVELKDPELATAVAVFHIKQILAHWRPSAALQADFDGRRFVELLVFGWNAGPNAVLRLAQRMEQIDLPPERITVDSVHQAATALTTDSWLAKPARVAFAKKVAGTYFDARGGGDRLVANVPSTESAGSTGVAVIAAAAGLGAAVMASNAATDGDAT